MKKIVKDNIQKYFYEVKDEIFNILKKVSDSKISLVLLTPTLYFLTYIYKISAFAKMGVPLFLVEVTFTDVLYFSFIFSLFLILIFEFYLIFKRFILLKDKFEQKLVWVIFTSSYAFPFMIGVVLHLSFKVRLIISLLFLFAESFGFIFFKFIGRKQSINFKNKLKKSYSPLITILLLIYTTVSFFALIVDLAYSSVIDYKNTFLTDGIFGDDEYLIMAKNGSQLIVKNKNNKVKNEFIVVGINDNFKIICNKK